jgi:hypothetical protein
MTESLSTSTSTLTTPLPLTEGDRAIFSISPLIRLTLLLFYLALMGPLPFLAQATQAAVSPALLVGGIGLGLLGLYGALGQRVEVTGEGIGVTYPVWIRWLFRGGWHLPWAEVKALKPRSTGQGGIVYYFVGADAAGAGQQRAYLLPMRVAGFARLVALVEAYTGIDTQDVKPLAQPWMYFILLGLTLLLLWVDLWTITTAMALV